MNDKALTNAELEFTQKLQLHFPRGEISPEVLVEWNGCPKEIIRGRLLRAFSEAPDPCMVDAELGLKPTAESSKILTLTSTGPTFGEWLKAREELHKFLTGETVVLREMFVDITDELLARTDIIPIFRPAGATNRMAMYWKKKLGIDVWEETNVMKYKNSKGPKVPELCFTNRSVRPDEDTLGKKAKSPDGILEIKLKEKTAWTNLYGWSDADNLHFKILNEHLDPETWTWFPEDRLPDGRVARGRWLPHSGRVGFRWFSAGYCYSSVGFRLATYLTLKTS